MRNEVLKLLKNYYEKNNIECVIGRDNKIHFATEEDSLASRAIFFGLCSKYNIAEKVKNVLETKNENSVLSVGVANLTIKKEFVNDELAEILDEFMVEALKDELNV